VKEKLLNRIETNPKTMLGKPVIKGTRLTVEIILEKLAYGASEEGLFNRRENLFRHQTKSPNILLPILGLSCRNYNDTLNDYSIFLNTIDYCN
jgi:hypothetical protein